MIKKKKKKKKNYKTQLVQLHIYVACPGLILVLSGGL